jgi:hypothetical protein
MCIKYCDGDPVNRVDPTGLDWNWNQYWSDFGGVFRGYGQALWRVGNQATISGQWDTLNGVAASLGHYAGLGWDGWGAAGRDTFAAACYWTESLGGRHGAEAFGSSFGDVLIAAGTAGAGSAELAPICFGKFVPALRTTKLPQIGKGAFIKTDPFHQFPSLVAEEVLAYGSAQTITRSGDGARYIMFSNPGEMTLMRNDILTRSAGSYEVGVRYYRGGRIEVGHAFFRLASKIKF